MVFRLLSSMASCHEILIPLPDRYDAFSHVSQTWMMITVALTLIAKVNDQIECFDV